MMQSTFCISQRVWQLIIFISMCCGFLNAQESPIAQLPTAINRKIKTFFHETEVDRTPVESGIYLQRIVKSYNAVMQHSIIKWLEKEATRNSYAKEITYLLSQLDSLTTPKQGIVELVRAISAHNIMMQDAAYEVSREWQERAYCAIALQCSVILANSARQQLLLILDDVHSSLEYWREQKERPVKYFFHKSPLKWVTGKRQADEIARNIKKLEKLEHDIRMILGRLTKHIYAFNIEGDVNASYAWIEKLLSVLSCVGLGQQIPEQTVRFNEIAEKLRFKLSCVDYLKDTILAKVASARKPGHVARNWLLYATAALGAYQARNFYVSNTDFVHESLKRSAESVGGIWKSATDPVKDAWTMIFGGSSAAPEGENLLAKHAADIEKVLPGLEEKQAALAQYTAGGDEKTNFKQEAVKNLEYLLSTGKHTWFGRWGDNIVQDVKKGDLSSLRKASSDLFWPLNPTLKSELKEILIRLELADKLTGPLGVAGDIGTDVARILPPIASSTQIIIQFLNKFIKSNELNMKLLTLIPAFGIGLGVNKIYNWMVARDYSSIRLALLDINSLFIESKTPLNDHDYGKLIYLLQGLKKQALRYLTRDDMLNDFLADIAKLESDKFDVETKRSIINNMFMKYPFLTLPVKSA